MQFSVSLVFLNVRTYKRITQAVAFPDAAVSVTSSGVRDLDDEGEDEDLRAAASHLNMDLPRLSDGEECDKERQEVREEERDSLTKRPSLEALLGPLPTAASLGLSDSIHKCVGEEKENENGEEEPRLSLYSAFTLHTPSVLRCSHFIF